MLIMGVWDIFVTRVFFLFVLVFGDLTLDNQLPILPVFTLNFSCLDQSCTLYFTCTIVP